MAEDIWDKYRATENDKDLSPSKEGEDPWAKYIVKSEDAYKSAPKLSYEEKEKKYRKALDEAKTPWNKVDATINLLLNKAKSQLPGIPGDQTMQEAISPSLTKGVPIARQFVPQTPELSKFENEHPYISTGLNAVGAIGSMAPAAGGASMAAAARGGTGFMPQFGSQLAINAPVNIADSAAKHGGFDKENLPRDLAWAGAQSAIPAAISSAFGQTQRATQEPYWNLFRKHMEPGGHTFPSGAPKPFPTTPTGTAIPQSHITASISPDTRSNLTTALGALAGLHYGDLPGAVTGGIIGKYGRHVIEPLQDALGRGMANPSTQDIIRALAHVARKKLEPSEAELAASSGASQ